MAGEHLFIDESSRRNYYFSVAIVGPTDLASARQSMRGLLLRGQRSLHMKDESDPRRRSILSAIATIDTRAVLFECALTAGHASAREDCLRAATEFAIQRRAVRMVLDRSDSTLRRDRRIIEEMLKKHGVSTDSIQYDHRARHEEPLLWIADALAWSWGRPGEFGRRASQLLQIERL